MTSSIWFLEGSAFWKRLQSVAVLLHASVPLSLPGSRNFQDQLTAEDPFSPYQYSFRACNSLPCGVNFSPVIVI